MRKLLPGHGEVEPIENLRRRVAVILLLACFIVFCGTDLLLAQRRGGTREASHGCGTGDMEKIVPMEYDTMPFDITRERLPPAYGGHNAQVIYNSLQNSMTKGATAGVAKGQGPAYA